MKAMVFALTILTLSGANATVDVSASINVSTEVSSWANAYSEKVKTMKANGTYPANGYTECRETNEIRSAYLCLSNTQVGMNSSLARASMFIEGLGDPKFKGVITRQDSPSYSLYRNLIGGHDLRGADLLRFHGALTSACQQNSDPQVCPNLYEQDIFDNFIVPLASHSPDFVVISFASQSSMSWSEVVTHEIMHAQYFNDPRFRQVTDDFWANELSESERAAIKSRLGRNYDASDELLAYFG